MQQAIDHYNLNDPRGEFVIVICGNEEEIIEDAQDIEEKALEKVQEYIDNGDTLKDAVKYVSETMKVPKNSLYKRALEKFKD